MHADQKKETTTVLPRTIITALFLTVLFPVLVNAASTMSRSTCQGLTLATISEHDHTQPPRITTMLHRGEVHVATVSYVWSDEIRLEKTLTVLVSGHMHTMQNLTEQRFRSEFRAMLEEQALPITLKDGPDCATTMAVHSINYITTTQMERMFAPKSHRTAECSEVCSRPIN